MDRERAQRKVQNYIDGWRDRDVDRALSTLTSDVVIVECDGSTARGLEDVARWLREWHEAPMDGRVTAWSITRFLFDGAVQTAAIEWDFACTCHGAESTFLGSSIIAFENGKISRIHEYRMEKVACGGEDAGERPTGRIIDDR